MDTISDPRGAARFASIGAWLVIAFGTANAGAALALVRAAGGFGGGLQQPDDALRAASAVQVAAVLYIVAYVLAMIAIGRWIYVTARNARAWSTYPSITPGWAIGWFFVPIACWWKPFEGVRETYQASVDPAGPATVPVPPIMRLWWGGWIIGNILGRLPGIAVHAPEPEAAIETMGWTAAQMVVIVLQSVALLAVIRATTRAQQARLSAGVAEVFS